MSLRSSLLLPALVMFTVVGGAAAPGARAGTVTVDITPASGAQYAADAGLDLDTLKATLQTEVETLFRVLDLEDYVRSFSEAQAFTTKGLGVDYASNLRLVEVGITGSVAANADDAFAPPKATKAKPPISGVGANLTLMAGINLGLIGLSPVTLFGNMFSRSGTLGRNNEFSGDFRNLGFHVHVKLLRPDDGHLLGMIHWGGIGVTAGFDQSRMKLSLSKNLKTDIPLGQVGGQAAKITMDNMGTFSVDLQSWSVPLEITTSLRLFYLATIYAGGGIDLQPAGDNEVAIRLDGNMIGTVGSQPPVEVGKTAITASETAAPVAGRARGILGVQGNLSILRLFTQLNVMPGSPTLLGVAFGARLGW